MGACEDLEAVIFNPELSSQRIRSLLAELGDVTHCILSGIEAIIADESWIDLEPWLFAANELPSRKLTSILCGLLVRRIPEVNNEDIVWALEAIADPDAVRALEHALLWEPEWDEFHALGVKCVWALAAIGTSDAQSVLYDAASVGPREVRDAARQELGRLK